MCKITKYVWQWVLIFGIASLSLNYSSHLSGHRFVKEIEALLGQTLWAIFSVPQSFSKSTFWLHLTTASKFLELELQFYSNWRSWNIDSWPYISFNVSSRFRGVIVLDRLCHTYEGDVSDIFLPLSKCTSDFIWPQLLNYLS